MTPDAITSALAAAQALFLPINEQPIDSNLVRLSNTISLILLKATYERINGVRNLWGPGVNVNRYLHHYGAPFMCPATCLLCCYEPDINAEATCVKCVHAKMLGSPGSKTTRLLRPLSVASRSSSKLVWQTHMNL